jgi:hypothetical protein
MRMQPCSHSRTLRPRLWHERAAKGAQSTMEGVLHLAAVSTGV